LDSDIVMLSHSEISFEKYFVNRKDFPRS